MRNQKVQMLVEMAVAIALAMVLNKLVLFTMPQGGSVSLEMLPLIFISLRWGFVPGLLAGTAQGLLQLAFGAYIAHPVQMILDYPLAFALLGLAGLFKTNFEGAKGGVNIIIGSILASFGRFACHLISGAVFFAEYAPKGQNPWIYSAIYNGSYILPSIIGCIVILLLVGKRMANINKQITAA